ncbi:MAG: hypothetical protein AABZ32_01345, partial [Bacteroidota bacterium]
MGKVEGAQKLLADAKEAQLQAADYQKNLSDDTYNLETAKKKIGDAKAGREAAEKSLADANKAMEAAEKQFGKPLLDALKNSVEKER